MQYRKTRSKTSFFVVKSVAFVHKSKINASQVTRHGTGYKLTTLNFRVNLGAGYAHQAKSIKIALNLQGQSI